MASAWVAVTALLRSASGRFNAHPLSWGTTRTRRMTFACGVRFIRLRSSSESGRASRSARAARSIWSAVIGLGGLGILPEIVVLLTLGCPPGGNNANALVTFGVGYIQHSVTLRHADDDKPLLAIVFPIIDAFERNTSLNTVFAKPKLTP